MWFRQAGSALQLSGVLADKMAAFPSSGSCRVELFFFFFRNRVRSVAYTTYYILLHTTTYYILLHTTDGSFSQANSFGTLVSQNLGHPTHYHFSSLPPGFYITQNMRKRKKMRRGLVRGPPAHACEPRCGSALWSVSACWHFWDSFVQRSGNRWCGPLRLRGPSATAEGRRGCTRAQPVIGCASRHIATPFAISRRSARLIF
jgi:hypothetical protein